MRISELMTTDVITVGPETPLKEAARRMLEAGVSGLPVTDDDGGLVGIITEADFVKTEATAASQNVPAFSVGLSTTRTSQHISALSPT